MIGMNMIKKAMEVAFNFGVHKEMGSKRVLAL